MAGWQKLWQDPEVVKRWEAFPPLEEVVTMADRLDAAGRRRVLDIGCGLGRHTLYLAARGFDVTATDNAPAAIAACEENLAQANLQATIVKVEMTEFPFSDGVIASHVIHHVDIATLRRIINSITQKLAPGGLFVWAMPSDHHSGCGRGREIEPGTWVNDDHPEGPVPHHYSTEEEVRELLRAYEILSLKLVESGEGAEHRSHWRVLARKRDGV